VTFSFRSSFPADTASGPPHGAFYTAISPVMATAARHAGFAALQHGEG